jgi:ribonuclease-3
MNETLAELETVIGYRFGDRALLLEALTHRSFVNEAGAPGMKDNERLEFFGDAILAFCVSRELLEHFPASSEGELTKARAALVDEQSLAAVAGEIGLGTHLRLGRGEDRSGGRTKRSLLANAFEALLAAVYLDGGMDAALRLVRERLVPHFGDLACRTAGRDAKTEFQELSQATCGVTPRYALVEVSGPHHARCFTVAALLGEEECGRGQGRSKKDAEQEAARSALERLRTQAGSTGPRR